MQQKKFSCQKMVKAIRDAIRAGARPLNRAGSIRISLVPYTREADILLGDFSDNNDDDDFCMSEYSYSLNPKLDFMRCDVSDYVTISVKKRSLYGQQDTEGATERVYIWKDFFDITVRVCGDEKMNRALAKLAFDAVKPFFLEPDSDYSVIMPND